MLTMVKTTIILDDELYKDLVQESIERYGSTRKLSLLINEKLRRGEGGPAGRGERLTIELGRKLSSRELERAIDRGWSESLKWKQ